jgi:hypothetical protein
MEDLKRVADGRRLVWTIFAFCTFLGALGYGFHLWRNYQKIEARLYKDEALRVRPFHDDQTVEEIGQVFYVGRDLRLREGRLNLIWGVRINKKRWSCEYEGGFSQWREGDAVHLIRQKDADDESDYTAYVVGLSGNNAGVVSLVNALDDDDLAGDVDTSQDQ